MVTREQSKRADRPAEGKAAFGHPRGRKSAATPPLRENLSPQATQCQDAIENIARAILSVDGTTGELERVKMEMFATCHHFCDSLSPISFEDEEAKLAESLNALNIAEHGGAVTQHQRLIKEAIKRAYKDQQSTKDFRSLISKYTSAFVGMRLLGVTASNFEIELKARPAPGSNGKRGLDRFKAEFSRKFGKRRTGHSSPALDNPAVEAAKYFAKYGAFPVYSDNSPLGDEDHQFACLLYDILEEASRRKCLISMVGSREDIIQNYELEGPHEDECVYMMLPDVKPRHVVRIKKLKY